MPRILYIASLHHPQQLLAERARTTEPLAFPSSMAHHFYERVQRQQGWQIEVFWRNLPGWTRDIGALRPHRQRARLTPGQVISALWRRVPHLLNPDLRWRNAHLLSQARAFQPDIVWLVGDNTVITPQTLARIKAETGCTLIYTSGTSPIVFSHAIEREAAPLYDWVFVNDLYHGVQWLELGARRMVCLPVVAIDPEHHAGIQLSEAEQAQYRADVAFVGTLLPPRLYSQRIAALEALRSFDLGIWSVHDVPETLRAHLRGPALGAEMLRVLKASAISLNVHGDFMQYGGNMRLFEAAAVGAFQIVDERPGLGRWFTPGVHLVTYGDEADLRDQVAYYLAHPEERQRMAQAARAHVLAYHTYDQRWAQMLAYIHADNSPPSLSAQVGAGATA